MGREAGGILRESVRFFRTHWVHLVLMIPGAVLYTILHEGMHALAVVLQGGRVIEFVWLPSAADWGHIRYLFPPGAAYSDSLIAMAPYVLTGFLVLVAVLSTIFVPGRPFWLASTIFFWLYIVPLIETANAALPYAACGANNDFLHGLGPPTPDIALGILLAGCVAAAGGFFVQKRLYGERALSFGAYAVLTTAAVGLLFAAVLGPIGFRVG